MRKLFRKIHLYFEGRRIWDAKMSEHLQPRLISRPDDNRIKFAIEGEDFKKYIKFEKQHEDCFIGSFGDQFSYTFSPSAVGTLITVKCSCGQTLRLGDIVLNGTSEYDFEEYRVLSDADRRNARFENAILMVMNLKNPHVFRVSFEKEPSFEIIYAVATTYASSLTLDDERFCRCILYKYSRNSDGIAINNYEGLDDKGKIDAFYSYFEEHIKIELKNYDCKNKQLINLFFDKRGKRE